MSSFRNRQRIQAQGHRILGLRNRWNATYVVVTRYSLPGSIIEGNNLFNLKGNDVVLTDLNTLHLVTTTFMYGIGLVRLGNNIMHNIHIHLYNGHMYDFQSWKLLREQSRVTRLLLMTSTTVICNYYIC